ncbi:MAG: hypothetical protein K940chlam3_00091 [Chlamydiae bacterium]|nr:hypothetical protein [Chlamydiota bacterium]
MLEILTSTSAVGLFFSGNNLKIANISSDKGIPKITEVKTLDLANVKRLDIPNDQAILVSSLSARDVLVRSLQIKLTKKKDVDAVLTFQAEPLVPFPIEESILESIEISQTKSSTNLTILAVKKELIQSHIEALQKLDIDPEVVSTSPVALATFANALSSPSSGLPTLILHFGMDETLCILAEKGKLLAEHAIPLGLSVAVEALGSDKSISDVDFSSGNLEKMPTLHQFVIRLKQEVSRAIFALVKQHKGENIAKVLLTGHGASLNGIETIFSDGLHVEISRPEPQFGQTSEILQEYAIPIGLALDSMAGEDPAINFRKAELAYGDPWKRIKFPLLCYFGASIVIAFVLYFMGNAWIESRFDHVKENYSRLLKAIEKPYSSFENDFLEKNPYETSPPLRDMTTGQLMGRLDLLQNMILKSPNTFQLLPDTPRVSDVLAWLAKHPLVADESTGKPLLNIKNFQYVMVKRPDAKKKNEKYRVKVEIEFSSDIPKLAREFHDALIAPNDIVDPKGEVKWTSSGDIYRTSFYLRNRTPKRRKSL